MTAQGNLRLFWEWSMKDGSGANEPTPIVHNGTIFLAKTGNLVQPIDARTGDLIWENRTRPAVWLSPSRHDIHGDHRCRRRSSTTS